MVVWLGAKNGRALPGKPEAERADGYWCVRDRIACAKGAAPQSARTPLVGLADLWQQPPLLVFFLRHAGCALCRSHLRLLAERYPPFQAAGLAVGGVI